MVTSQQCRKVAELFRILSHPVRVQILCALRKQELCVGHLQELIDRPQPYISQQLRLLRESGIVAVRHDGLYVYYRLADPRIQTMLNEWLGPSDAEFPEHKWCKLHGGE